MSHSLVRITRVYLWGAAVSLADECATLQLRFHAQLSVHCRVTGRWVTRSKAVIQIQYCGPQLLAAELRHLANGVLRVMAPD